MLTLLLARLVLSVVAPMLLVVDVPEPLLMVKSVGSISQLPLLPSALRVKTLALSAMRTLAALVSTKPAFWFCPPEASSRPLSSSVPATLSPSKRMRPSELNPNGKTDPGTLHQSPAGKPAGFKKIVKSTKKIISIIKLLITT
jgi:hypothetical protein